jgi:hypothetical protein
MLIVWLASIALAQDDGCSSDGEIDAGTIGQFIYTDESVALSACGAVEECAWEIVDPAGFGSLSSATGTDVFWTAPSSLDNCTPQDVLLSLLCQDSAGEATEDSIELRVICTEEEKERVEGISEWELGGGGCTAPQYALLALLPLAGLRRRFS